MGVQRPGWWCYPLECQNGHVWAPGTILVGWTPCDCAPAVAAHGSASGAGHLVGLLRAPGVPVDLVPAAARAGHLTGVTVRPGWCWHWDRAAAGPPGRAFPAWGAAAGAVAGQRRPAPVPAPRPGQGSWGSRG